MLLQCGVAAPPGTARESLWWRPVVAAPFHMKIVKGRTSRVFLEVAVV
jgi:hypothetical protein